MPKFYRFLIGVLLFFTISCESHKDSLDLRNRVKKVVLDNGMTFLLLKREGAPVFSAEIKVRVGNIEEDPGSYGLAHFFEHMAFKGTDKIGSKDFTKEGPILDQIFALGTKIVEMKKQGLDPPLYEDLLAKRKALEKQQNEFIDKNEFTRIYQKNGGLNLNATTSNDYTTFYVSLPVSKLELWAYMESSRLMNPVMREFFTEVNVVAEERRMRIDNSPQGKLYAAFVDKAFDNSPYKILVIGPAQDIQNYTPAEARAFYEKYYIPSRMVVALVGNFNVNEAEKTVRKYFSKLPAKTNEEKTFKPEVFDKGSFPREVTVTGPEEPRFYLAYHRPTHPDPDDVVFDVLQNILCQGRTSRLYKKLVLETKKVSSVTCYGSVPGGRLDSLFTFYTVPLEGHASKVIKEDIKNELKKLIEEGPSENELQIVKNNLDASFIYPLQSNSGLASQLAFYEILTGDWKYIYHLQDRVHAINAEDVKRVAKKYFVEEREVSAYMEKR